jgi:hypothetical protein
MTGQHRSHIPARLIVTACALGILAACSKAPETPTHRTFREPEDAVRALNDAVARNSIEDVLEIFGPEGRDLLDSSDPVAARRSREVYSVAAAEGWRLVDRAGGKELVVGNEQWPFPVPLVKDAAGWRFDTAAGKEEVLARRIGRNELKAMQVCRTFVAAQRLYARRGHDGKSAGLYARVFRSDPGRQNGLYWPAEPGQEKSPLGDLVPKAAEEYEAGQSSGVRRPAVPFHGYHFRILTAQGSSAPGGAKDYIVNGELSGGFALVAWPAQYDRTGIMTLIVNHDGVVHEKDLGPATDRLVKSITAYDPDASWSAAESTDSH